MNRCDCVLVVSQYGSDVSMELEPGESRPLHWADGRQGALWFDAHCCERNECDSPVYSLVWV